MAIIVGIFCLAALIIVHEAGHFVVARLFGMRVSRFSIGFFKPLIEWTPRNSETTYSIGALPLGGYVQIDGLSPVDEVDPEDRRSYANQPIYAKLAMIMSGPAANFVTAVVLLAILLTMGMERPVEEPIVGRAEPGHPAHEAGLRSGDRLLAIDGQEVDDWAAMATAIQSHRGEEITLRYRHDGEEAEMNLTPDPDTGLIGIAPATRLTEPLGPVEALGGALSLSVGTTVGMAVGIGRMITGQRTTAGVAGPVGIVNMMATAVQTGWRSLFWLLAQLSLSLFLFNFLPIPALDGGRVVFLGIEAITRRRVNRKVEGYVHAAGLLLVLGLVLLVTFRDVLDLL